MNGKTHNKSQTRLYWMIFLVAFLNLVGFGMIIPLLPYYARTFSASTVEVGYLVGIYAMAQFLGAPVWGRISDRYGRRLPLILSHLGAAVSYILFGLAGNLFILFTSRAVGGLMNGNISVAQAYISDITGASDRAKGLGIIGAAFGLGFVIGPALGGILSEWGYAVPAFTAAGLNLLNMIAIYFLLPETRVMAEASTPTSSSFKVLDLVALRRAMQKKVVEALLIIRLFFSLAFSIFTTVFALYAEYALHLSERTTSYVLAYIGVLIILVQAFLIGPLTRRVTEGRLLVHSLWMMTLALGLWAFVQDVYLLLVTMLPLAVASGIFNTVINSTLSKAVAEEEIGGILGLSASLDSLTRVFAPVLGGYLLQDVGPFAPGLVSAVLLAGFIFYGWKKFYHSTHPALAGNLPVTTTN